MTGLTRAGTIMLLAALAIGCGTTAIVVNPAHGAFTGPDRAESSRRSAGSDTETLYVGSLNAMSVYSTPLDHPHLDAIVTTGVSTPVEMCADSHGTLYVANEPLGDVVEYAPNVADQLFAPTQTLTDLIFSPTGVAVDAKGTVYVSTHPAFHIGLVAVFPSGHIVPSHLLRALKVFSPGQLAVDVNGNLYVTGASPNGVFEYVAEQQRVKKLQLSGIGTAVPFNIAFDSQNHLYVVIETAVLEYDLGKPDPIRTIPLQYPVAVSIDAQGNLFVGIGTEVQVIHPGQTQPFEHIRLTSGLGTYSVAVSR